MRLSVLGTLGVTLDSRQDEFESMWKLCIEDDQANRTIVNLVRKEYSLGRAEANAIRLTERNISRQHARLERSDRGWILRDLGSYTGSFVRGSRVSEPHRLEHGDQLRLGDYSLAIFDGAATEVEEIPPDVDGTATVPAVGSSRRHLRLEEDDEQYVDRLVVIEGPEAGQAFPLRGQRLLAGRGEECDISLSDTSVSRVHLAIEPEEDDRFRVVDQGSSNGLRVNGRERRKASLYSGDVIELGDVQLQYVARGHAFDPASINTSSKGRSGLWNWLAASTPGKLTAVAAIGGVSLGLLLTTIGGEPEPASVHSPVSPAQQAIAAASAYWQQGDIESAHATLAKVGSASNVREMPLYRKIEADWADQQFRTALQSSDHGARRKLLEEIASAPGVDIIRRRRADKALEDLSDEQVFPTDLPKAIEIQEEDEPLDPESLTPIAPEALPPAIDAPAPQ